MISQVPMQAGGKTPMIHGRYRPLRRLGSGSFGEIYLGVSTEGEKVAIKFEKAGLRCPQLRHEYKVYRELTNCLGIARVYHYGTYGTSNVMIMDLLGASLEDLFTKCGRRFSLKTTLKLADQILERVDMVHSRHLIHRDIKPANFVVASDTSELVYCIDFGLSKRYRNPHTMTHIPHRIGKSLTGTPRYASINNHLGVEHARRDDLEAIGYVLIYFFKGRLPWQGLKARNASKKYKMIMEKKQSTSISVLCAGCPPCFSEYLRYCRALKFDQAPNVRYLRDLFRKLYQQQGFKLETYGDNDWDWNRVTPPQPSLSAPSRDEQEEAPERDTTFNTTGDREKQGRSSMGNVTSLSACNTGRAIRTTPTDPQRTTLESNGNGQTDDANRQNGEGGKAPYGAVNTETVFRPNTAQANYDTRPKGKYPSLAKEQGKADASSSPKGRQKTETSVEAGASRDRAWSEFTGITGTRRSNSNNPPEARNSWGANRSMAVKGRPNSSGKEAADKRATGVTGRRPGSANCVSNNEHVVAGAKSMMTYRRSLANNPNRQTNGKSEAPPAGGWDRPKTTNMVRPRSGISRDKSRGSQQQGTQREYMTQKSLKNRALYKSNSSGGAGSMGVKRVVNNSQVSSQPKRSPWTGRVLANSHPRTS
uniref:Casein kinase I n=1 Tax=Octactis speculum TaxID=3111310 RepID=A0A7S2HUS5_9STRA